MTILIVDSWAHRLRNDGLMESALVVDIVEGELTGNLTDVEDSWDTIDFTGLALDSGLWAVRPPADVELTGGEYSTIQQTINRVASQFPEGRPGLPKSEKPTQTTVEPGAIR
jgi:hypothetical protein